MRKYTITKQDSKIGWDTVPAAPIDNYLWEGKVPICAQAQLCYDNKALYIRLCAQEAQIRAEETGPLGCPCDDSCLEFFFSPIPGDSRYFNIECNPNGCVFLGFGSNRYNLVRLQPLDMPVQPKIEKTADGWSCEYQIPYDFIRMFFPSFSPASGSNIYANFYKCGDKTPQPHFIAWNPIELKTHDFHRPDFFGELVFE